ncbi:UDP-N-acetylglucosamine--undecaprenyl-phosphate N-acetylglucosaminephosphotransferase [Vibrio europaeus]|uniref:Undecaprenyl-phosphate alpha-N-acetylglucosaminyl 1-phosphate transferase n=1 Tax=Vibrio europaeus TaxID=300876 RepID=A0AAE7B1H1_9VIBR|nr:UDP-N-acetylglucosamine--undecaprenyl-phosphate N-acetylglucosaminephosphotransferase [Vibrio europaeus]MDC5812480.1 UDP-N-acetylglucosamine--undecaprenyl-phosphate N-acetylglucosaminephosphotransferase [Vibrio europaeus]QJY38884.1 UDP-N-acetylglucosamine--undecaprenyl-phosphate N-acetylglucosaminephosphotransferase [Vibrio europaeus]QPG33906.1 UDP-N-acetylglucosamine--undecaprenyl-phosphate N-acetylglucosaminephosphotransferase [Vibrio europaeus]
MLVLPVVFITSVISLLVLRKVAFKLMLVDTPNDRKSHDGCVPLVGGIAVYLSLLLVGIWERNAISLQSTYFTISGCLVLLGVIDDKFDISAKARLFILLALSIWLVLLKDFSFHYLGNFIDVGAVYMSSPVGCLFSVLAIVFSIVCFNMIDGIDGLLGSIAIVVLSSLAVLFELNNQSTYVMFCLVLIVALLPYIVMNLTLKLPKDYRVFMGDSGSLLIGFTIVWLLVVATQPNQASLFDSELQNKELAMSPVTALWLIAMPLMDMLTVMAKRLLNGNSPLKADRSHFHHLLMSVGLSSRESVVLIALAALVFAVIGVLSEIRMVHEATMFFILVYVFLFYFVSNLLLENVVKMKMEVTQL